MKQNKLGGILASLALCLSLVGFAVGAIGYYAGIFPIETSRSIVLCSGVAAIVCLIGSTLVEFREGERGGRREEDL